MQRKDTNYRYNRLQFTQPLITLDAIVFVVCGLNHKSAPLNIREQLSIPSDMEGALLKRLIELPEITEAVILSTCNRTEIYCDTLDAMCLLPWLANEFHMPLKLITDHFYIHYEHEALRHMLRVASGLDSMMLGEPQILGQMKQAYQQACHVGTVGKKIRDRFQCVFSASKRIRNISGIGNNPISVAFAAVQLIGQHLPNYAALNVLLIGSGETASLVAKYLHQKGVSQFMVANRSHEHANRLAQAITGKSLSISDIPQYLSQADVVVSATACPLPFISKNMVDHALTTRNNKPMFLLDLAVPRDIEADVAHLADVHLYNIDDLQNMIDKSMDERRLAATHAETLIDVELENHLRWHRSRRAKDAICDYRNHMESLAQTELKRALQKLSAGQCHYNVLTEFSQRLVNKLAHAPTTGLRQVALDNREELLDLAHYLFNGTEVPYEEIT